MNNVLTYCVKTVAKKGKTDGFGKWFKPIIESSGLVQKVIADEAGITAVSLSRILSGNHGTSKQTAIDLMNAVNKLTGRNTADVDAGLQVLAGIELRIDTTDSHEILDGITITFQNIQLSKNEQEDILSAMRFVARGAIEEFKESKDTRKGEVKTDIIDGDEGFIIESPEDLVKVRQKILNEEKGKKKK